MKRPDNLPPEVERLIPSTIEKGIFPRFYKAKDGSTNLIWWVRVWKDRKPIRQSSESNKYTDAVNLKRKLIAEMETGERAGGAVDRVRIPEIVDDYIDECRVSPDTLKEYRYTAEAHLKPLLKNVKAHKLTTDRLKQYRRERISRIVAKKRPANSDELERVKKSADTTVNRDFALLRAAMNHATRRTPPKVLKVPHFPMVSEDNARQGFLEQGQYEKLRDAFMDSSIRLLFVVGYNIGCRSGELRKIEWSMVDLEAGVIRLPGRITKNGKPRTVPIFEGDYMDLLRAEKQEHDDFYPTSPWVFSRVGKLINDFRVAWENACVKAACPDLLFHDLRRTAVRNMTRIHGLDKATAKKISGHLTDSVFDRYDIIDEEDIKAAKRKVDTNRTSVAGAVATSNISPALLDKLSAIPEDKLKALIALLGS